MTERPMISVIIPTFNREYCIERAINSVINQVYKNWEIIIVDGSLNDATYRLIFPYLTDHRIQYFKKEKINSSESLNFGIKRALGNYIALLDDDDEFMEDKLEIQLSEMISYNADFSISNCIKVIDGKKITPKVYRESFLLMKEDLFRGRFHLSHTHMMFNASIKELCIFDPSLPASDDFDLIVRLMNKIKILLVKEPLAYINKSAKRPRISNNPRQRIETIEKLIVKSKTYDWTKDEKLILKTNLTLRLGFWQLMDREYKRGRFNIYNALPSIPSDRRRKYLFLLFLSYIPPLFRISKLIAEHLWSISTGRIKI